MHGIFLYLGRFSGQLKSVKSGGTAMAVFLGLVVALIICQNLLAVGLSHVLHLNPLIGMCTGSIPMVGGHGTAGAFGPVLEDFNIQEPPRSVLQLPPLV